MKRIILELILLLLPLSGYARNGWVKVDGDTDLTQRKSDWQYCDTESQRIADYNRHLGLIPGFGTVYNTVKVSMIVWSR